jgi:hypothetical protein
MLAERDAACESLVERLVAIVEGIHHHHARGHRAGGLVDIVVERRVRVWVDDAGGQPLAGCVYNGRGSRSVDGRAHSGDLAGMNPDRSVFDGAVAGRHDGGILQNDILSLHGLGQYASEHGSRGNSASPNDGESKRWLQEQPP